MPFLPELYSLPSADFNDITTGNNGFNAGPGYDLVTGLGTPQAPLVVTGLVGAVASSTPAAGSVVRSPPTDFTITFASRYTPSTIAANDFTVNGVAADSFTLINSTTGTFHYDTSPVSQQGLQFMSIAAGAITWQSDGAPLAAFNASFRYDVLPIAVDAAAPANGSVVTLPLTTLTLHFNEAYAPSSISDGNLTLSQGDVSGYSLVDSQTVAYTLSGISKSGALTINMAAGAVTDAFGNPGPAYSGTLHLNYPPVPFPAPLASVAPAGSLIYESSASGSINPGSTDSYILSLAAGETLSLVVNPAPGLQAQLGLSGPGTTVSASATSVGVPATLESVAITTAGSYTLTVAGLNGSTGGYTLQADLNAALSAATVGGATSHSRSTAQNIDPSFVNLAGTAQRGAVIGALATSVGPDGFGYSAQPISRQFNDISPTGASPTPNAPVLVGADDDSYALTPANLAGFYFKFYNSTYNTIYVSSNGLLSFGSANTVSLNTDLTSSPSQPVIAPLWDDLVVTGASQSGVYWQVQGSGSGQRLVVQWNDVSFNGGAQTGPITFEAILGVDGTIVFNYKNLYSGDAGAGSASATVGIKAAGTQGSDRLLVSFNSAANPLVASGTSLEMGAGLASPAIDYFSYTLAAGQTTTLAVTTQNSLAVNVSLEDAQGNVLATGSPPGNGSAVSSSINNFVAPAAGTYFAVVTGAAGAAYSLVVNRDADFDLESSSGFATAQDISGTQGVLGDILASPASPTENWYSVDLAADEAILLQTVTPPGAGSQFADDLAPQIQVYNPADVLVASGQGPGNQTLAFVATTAGAYRIRVSGNNSTNGEYFLSATLPDQVTSVSDSGSGSLRQALLDLAGVPGVAHLLEFDLPAGSQSIDLLSPLPTLSDPLVALLDATQDVTISSSSATGWDNFNALAKTGDGKLTLSETNSFRGNIEVDAGSLCFNEPDTLTFAPATDATVAGTGTLELAGNFSDLTGAINITNNSAAGNGILISGTSQVIGGIDGTGCLAVTAGSDLTANQIAEGALMIGGTVGSPATVTIAASNAAGNPLTTTSSISCTAVEALATSSGHPPIEHDSSRSLTEDISAPTSVATLIGTFDGALQAQRLAPYLTVGSPPGLANLPPDGLTPWKYWNGSPGAAASWVAPGIRPPSVAHDSLDENLIVGSESPANCDREMGAVDAVFASDFNAVVRRGSGGQSPFSRTTAMICCPPVWQMTSGRGLTCLNKPTLLGRDRFDGMPPTRSSGPDDFTWSKAKPVANLRKRLRLYVFLQLRD